MLDQQTVISEIIGLVEFSYDNEYECTCYGDNGYSMTRDSIENELDNIAIEITNLLKDKYMLVEKNKIVGRVDVESVERAYNNIVGVKNTNCWN